MIRLGLGIAIVTAIYLHSPVRPNDDLTTQAAGWIEQAKAQLATGTATASAASLLQDASLRHTFSALTDPEPAATAPGKRP